MRKRADIAAELIYAALTSSKAVSFDGFLEYLDFYADLRAGETVPAAPDQATAPLLELNARNEYETADEGSAEDVDEEPEKVPTDGAFTGKGAGDKLRIFKRLTKYREANGLGCAETLAAKARGVDANDIRRMCHSEKVELRKWLAVDEALNKVEADRDQAKDA